jgi:hypothetical protein
MKLISIFLICLGVICTFAGAFAKIEQWPYANQLMIIAQIMQWIGVILFANYFYNKNKPK